MARTLSSLAVASQNAQDTNEVWLVLLTVDHAELGGPLRFVNNNENITSNGEVFYAFPFTIVLPAQDSQSPANCALRIDNVDRTIVASLRNLTSAPTVRIDVILASAPNVLEISLPDMKLTAARYDVNVIEGEITPEPLLIEPITLNMTPSRFPGMF
jgi:hypothetical protein